MKKILSLLLTVVVVLSISATAYALEPDEYKFSATVITCRYIETTDRYSFCAVGDVYGNGNREPFTFGVSRENIKIAGGLDIRIEDGLAMGRIISIVFNGEVMESYPMQINPNYIVVEEEIEELTADEQYNYLSMFYTEEWLIENGYMEVPPAEGEAVPPVTECDEDTTLPSENEEIDDGEVVWEDGDLSEDDTPSDEDMLVCGVPLEDDESGKCIVLSGRCLEGFVVATEYFDGSDSAYIYFWASTNFNDEMVTPVRLEVSKATIGLIDIDFYEIESGMNLKIHCTPESYCVMSDNEKFFVLDGEVLTIEKLEGFTENYSEFESLFFEEAPIPHEVGYMTVTDKWLEGFVVASEFSMNDDDGSENANTEYAYVYFFAEDSFGQKIVNPVLIKIDETTVDFDGIEFWEIESGVRLRIYCSEESVCEPVEGKTYNRLIGTVYAVSRLDGNQGDYHGYEHYFWPQHTTDVEIVDVDVPIDTDDGGEEAALGDEAVCGTSDTQNGAMTVLWIAVCGGITVAAVVMVILLLKKK